MRLEGLVAVVTGSTRGIGREIAVRFAGEGARVVVHGMDPRRAEEVKRLCGNGAEVFLGDTSEQTVAEGLAAFAMEKFGRLDILVANAGAVTMEPFLEFEAKTWQRHLDVHLSGAFYCAQAAARRMAKAGSGRILTVSTIAAAFGQFGFAAYAPVKAGVEALTRVMAVELARHDVTVNCIAPGPVWNEMMEKLYGPERLAERCRTIPLGRLAQPGEVADLAVFLASPEAKYITGQVLRVDGGASAAGPYTMEVYRKSQPGA